ncbi:MAG: EamA family transporter [Acidiferrobacter sp.]
MRRFSSGYGLVVVAALLWSTAGVASVWAPAGIPAASFADVRLGIGGCGMALMLGPARLWRALTPQGRGPLFWASGALALFQWTFFAAVAHAGVVLATVVSTAAAPLVAESLAAIQARVRLRYPWWAALCFVVLGLVLVGAVAGPISTLGLFWALTSGALYAIFTRAIRVSQGADGDDFAVTAWALLIGAVVLMPMTVGHLGAFLSVRGLAVAAYLGVMATALPYGAYVLGLRRLSPTSLLAVLWVQPLAGIVLGFLVLHETLGLRALLGVGCMIGAMIGLTAGRKHASPDLLTVQET